MADIIKIDSNTWRIEDGMVRFYLFCGETKAALIDSGMTTENAREIAEVLTQLPLIMINTHADRDHVAGNPAFEESYMAPAEEDNYRANHKDGRIVPVGEGDVIDLGGRTLRVIDIPGHTPGSIALLDEKNRVLVSGDSVQDGNIFMFGSKRNLKLYIESLKHLRSFDGTYDDIYPMHGTFPVKPGLVPQLIEGAQEILDGKATGSTVDIFGNEVMLYKFPYAGFLCEK
jgi:glyoxylase-like metal-dependent hydrolase (beta-lactamase superfamily II)